MPDPSLNDQIFELALTVVRQQDPELADLFEALATSSDADAWKKAGDRSLDWAMKAPTIADARIWYILACGCFERYVALSRKPVGQ